MQAAYQFYNDVNVRAENVIDVVGPANAGWQPVHPLASVIPVADVSQTKTGRRILRENPCNRTADGTESDHCDRQDPRWTFVDVGRRGRLLNEMGWRFQSSILRCSSSFPFG
jgi:hypothetical protein